MFVKLQFICENDLYLYLYGMFLIDSFFFKLLILLKSNMKVNHKRLNYQRKEKRLTSFICPIRLAHCWKTSNLVGPNMIPVTSKCFFSFSPSSLLSLITEGDLLRLESSKFLLRLHLRGRLPASHRYFV